MKITPDHRGQKPCAFGCMDGSGPVLDHQIRFRCAPLERERSEMQWECMHAKRYLTLFFQSNSNSIVLLCLTEFSHCTSAKLGDPSRFVAGASKEEPIQLLPPTSPTPIICVPYMLAVANLPCMHAMTWGRKWE